MAIGRLVDKGDILRVEIEDLSKQEFYLRRADLAALKAAARKGKGQMGAAFIAPLDNLMWDHDQIEMLFDFHYRWEVYVPEPKRKYGYYVLPGLYGERMVARFEPGLDRETKTAAIKNWWWEKGVNKKDEQMSAAIVDSFTAFSNYLGAEKIVLGESAKKEPVLKAAAKAVGA